MMPHTDIAVYRRSTGVWFIRRVTDAGLTLIAWGAPTLQEMPAQGDYDGDGETDVGVTGPAQAIGSSAGPSTRRSSRSPGGPATLRSTPTGCR